MAKSKTKQAAEDRQTEAKALRLYAKQQGKLLREYEEGRGVPYYREYERRGLTVRENVPGHLLEPDERHRQQKEAMKRVREARTNANRKARELERE